MNRVRLWILPAAVVVLLVVATFFLTVTEAGRGLVGLATGAASCDVLAPDTPVTGTLSAESVFDCYKFLADGTTYGADNITLRLISKSGKPFDADIYAPEKPVTAKNAGYKWITTKDTTEKKDTFTLDKDKGDYQVKVWSYAHDVGDYSFSFALTEPLQPEKPTAENQKVGSAACTAVTAGTAVTGTIDSSNQFSCYFFDAKADDQIVVSITSKGGTALDADLYAPGKQLTGGNTGYKWVTTSSAKKTAEISHKLDKGDGSYQVKAWSYNNVSQGDYELTVTLNASASETPEQVSAPASSEACSVITSGEAVTGTIDGSDKYDCFSYAGKSGEIISVEITSVSGKALDADVFDPSSTVDAGSAGYGWVTSSGIVKTVKNITLDKGDGTYGIKAWSFNHANAGGYELKVTSNLVVKAPESQPATPSQPAIPSSPATTTPSQPATPSVPATTTPSQPATPSVPATSTPSQPTPAPIPVPKPVLTYVVKDGESITGNPGVLLTGERGVGEIKSGKDQDTWHFAGNKGDHISLVLSAESSSLMPAVTLLSNKEILTWSEGVLRGNAVVDDIILPETRNYTILAHSGRETTGKYELALTITREETIKPRQKVKAKIDTIDLCKIVQGISGEGVEIAILDSGVDATHPDLDDLDDDPATDDPKVVMLDYTTGWGPDPVAHSSHGTQVAGVAAGTGQSASPAPGACVWGIKVLPDFDEPSKRQGIGFEEPIVAGIRRSVEGLDKIPGTGDEPDIISLTSGCRGCGGNGISAGAIMIDYAVNNGIVVTQSAGNGGPNFYGVNTRGTSYKGITVGRLNEANWDPSSPSGGKYVIDASSSRGPTRDLRIKPDLVAPGQNFMAPLVGGGYGTASGTSFSTPYIAGVAALILQKHPDWTPEMVRAVLMNTATPLKGYRLVTQGAGALNKDRAIAAEVLAMPPSLSFGLVTKESATAREITLFNTGSDPVTLDLSASTSVYKGEAYPWTHKTFSTCDPWEQGNDYETWMADCRELTATSTVVQVAPQQVTVPAGGSQTVSIEAGPFTDAEPGGWYEGRVTAAFSGGSESITVPYLMHHTPDADTYSLHRDVIYPGPGFFCANTGYMQYLINDGCNHGDGQLVLSEAAEANSVFSVANTKPRYPTSEDKIVITTLAAGTSPLSSVTLKWSIDGVDQPDKKMYDDGLNSDFNPGDQVYGTGIGPFAVGTFITYTVTLKDVNGATNTPKGREIEIIKPYERTADTLLIGHEGSIGYRAKIFDQTSTGDKSPLYVQILLEDLGLDYDYWDVVTRGATPDWVLQNYLDEGVVIVDAPGMKDLLAHGAISKYLDRGGKLFISGDNVSRDKVFFQDYLYTKDNNVDQGVFGGFGVDGDVIGDGIQFSIDTTRGGYPISSHEPLTWDPNPFWVQRIAERGIGDSGPSWNQNNPTSFELYAPAEPILTYDSSALARTGVGGVMKMDSCGSILDQWDLPDDHFGGPRDVAVAPSSEIYVLDTANHKIRVIDPRVTEKFITATDSGFATTTLAWGAFGVPRDIATDSSGNIYVLDNSDRIFKLGPDGDLITKWGGCGTAEGKFGNASKIVVDDQDEIYVLDTFHMEPDMQVTEIRYSRIHVFDSDGKFLRRWGKKGMNGFGETTITHGSLKINPEEIYDPLDLKVDSDGYVWVIDGTGFKEKDGQGGKKDGHGLSAAIKYDKHGNYIETPAEFYGEKRFGIYETSQIPVLTGDLGSGQGEFSSGNSAHAASDGNFYVADIGNRKILKFDSAGEFQWEYKSDTNATWKRIGSRGAKEGEFNFPNGISIDDAGNVYVADTRNHRIQKFDSSGVFVKSWGTKGSEDGEFNLPMGIGVSGDGFVYVADTWNKRIQKFDSDGNYLLKWESDPVTYPAPYTNSFGPLARENTRGKAYFQWPGSAFPKDIAIDSSGNVFVTELRNDEMAGRIQKFSPEGDLLDPAAEYRMGKYGDFAQTLDALIPGWGCGPNCAVSYKLSYGGVTVTPEGRVYAASYFVGRDDGGIETFVESYEGFEYAKYIANKTFNKVVWGLDSDPQGKVYLTVAEKVGSVGSGTAGLRLHNVDRGAETCPKFICPEGEYKVVLLGFGIGMIQSRLERQQVMARSLRWLDLDVGPILKQPRYGQMIRSGEKVTITWDEIDGAKDYRLEVTNSDGEDSFVLAETVSGGSYEFIPGGTGWYFWKVKARLSDYEESLWSVSNRFKVVKPARTVANYSGGAFCTFCTKTLLELGEGAISHLTESENFVEVHKDGVNGVDGLEGRGSVTVSPHGKHLYVTADVDNALTAFSRDISTGALTFLEAYKDGDGVVDGLGGASAAAVSPDGGHVYVAGKTDNAIAIFSRDTSTGALTFLEAHTDADGSGAEFWNVNFVTVSRDGNYLYATDTNSIRVFSRDSSSGALTFVEVHKDGEAGVDGISGVKSASISFDGKNVYAVAHSSVSVFSREPSTGALTFLEVHRNGENGVDNMDASNSLALSPDGNHVYVTGPRDHRLVIFSRNSSTGVLTFMELEGDDSQAMWSGMQEVSSVVVSPDGKYVYVGSSTDIGSGYGDDRYVGTLVMLKRDSSTGILKKVYEETETKGGVDGLGHVISYGNINRLAVSPDGLFIYVAGEEENAISVFRSLSTEQLSITQSPALDVYTGETLQPSPAAKFNSLVSTKDGNLIAFYGDISNETWLTGIGGSPSTNRVVLSITSKDNGLTWSQPVVVTAGESPVGVASDDGKLWLMYLLGSRPYLKLSKDDGKSWSEEKEVGLPEGIKVALPGNSANYRGETIDFDYSDSGRLIVFFRTSDWYGPSDVYITMSVDNGETWTALQEVSKPTGVDKYTKEPAGAIRTVESVDFMKNGDIWLVSRVHGIPNPSGLLTYMSGNSAYWEFLSGFAYKVSSDDGATWTEWRMLHSSNPVPGYNQGGNWTSYYSFVAADVAVSSTGQVAIVLGGTDDERSIWYKFDDPENMPGKPLRRFSPYLGKNETPHVAALPDGKFGIIWKSGSTEKSDGNYVQRPSVRYGVIDHVEDIAAPPVLGEMYQNSCIGNHNCPLQAIFHFPGNPSEKDKVLFKVKAADHDNITKVHVVWSLDGVEQAPISMTDHKKYNDNKDIWASIGSDLYGTRVYGAEYGPFAPGSIIEYQISAADVLGNTVVHPLERTTIKIPMGNPFIREVDATGVTLKASAAANLKSLNQYDVSMEHDATGQNKTIYWYDGVSRTDSDNQGNLFVLTPYYSYLGNLQPMPMGINKYDAHGSLLKIFKVDDVPYATTTPSGNPCTPGPYDMAVDGQGNIYVTDNCVLAIHKLTSEGVYIESYSSPCGFSLGNPTRNYGAASTQIAIDKDSGAIYIQASVKHGYGTIKLDTSGNCDQNFFARSTYHHHGNIAVDSVGNVYMSRLFSNSAAPKGGGPVIYKYGPDGTKLAEWGYIGDNDEEFSGKQHSLVSLAIGKNGFLYASDSGKGEIKKFTTDGTFVSKWEGMTVGVGIPQDGYFSKSLIPSYASPPLHISIDDSTGNIYVTDSCNQHDCRDHKKRIQVFSPF